MGFPGFLVPPWVVRVCDELVEGIIVHMYTSVKGFVSLLGDGHDGLAVRDRPPLDPSMLQRRTFSMLRVSGPSPRMDSRLGASSTDSRRPE